MFNKKSGSNDVAKNNAAANELESDKMGIEVKATADALEEKKQRAGEIHFVYEGRVFKPKLPRVIIPGIGKRTALELCFDEKAQEYLVKENCIGSVIEEII